MGGTIAINGGEPAPIEGVAESFVAAFPDIEVMMDDLVVIDGVVEYHWTFTGTSAETGKSVRMVWTLDGPFATADYSYRLTSDFVQFDNNGFTGLHAEGRLLELEASASCAWPIRSPGGWPGAYGNMDDGVAHPDADIHGKTLEASRRPARVRKSQKLKNEYDF